MEELQREATRNGVIVALIAGLALVGIGVLLLVLGLGFEEPAERLATRSVPKAAPIGLSIGGGVLALVGLVIAIRGLVRRG